MTRAVAIQAVEQVAAAQQAVERGVRDWWRHDRRRHGQYRLGLCQCGADTQPACGRHGADRGPVANPLIIAVLNQTVDGARQAFDALSGEVISSVHNTQGEEAQFARSAMHGRMRQSSYAGLPGDLGALGFGGPAVGLRVDTPVPLTPPRPRPAHAVPRAI